MRGSAQLSSKKTGETEKASDKPFWEGWIWEEAGPWCEEKNSTKLKGEKMLQLRVERQAQKECNQEAWSKCLQQRIQFKTQRSEANVIE